MAALHSCLIRSTAMFGLALLIASCSSASTDVESLGLAIDVDTQPGGSFEVTVAKDPTISVTSVSAPAGVTAAISEPDADTLTLSVLVESDTDPGTYTLLLQTERNGERAEVAWPFDVSEGDGVVPPTQALSPEEVHSQFVAALLARDGTTLQAMWPEASWATLGLDTLESFVPSLDPPACERLEEGRASCFVFEDDEPRVLGLTMDSVPGGWLISSVSLDSTN